MKLPSFLRHTCAVSILALVLSACAGSTASNSISESSGSVSSLSESVASASNSSTSSLGAERSAALERDVETATSLLAESSGDADALLRGVSALCERYALTDWEAEPAVARGIARGLAAAGLPEPEVARFAARAGGPQPAVRDALRDALAALP